MLAAYSDWEDRPNNTKKGSRFGDDSRLEMLTYIKFYVRRASPADSPAQYLKIWIPLWMTTASSFAGTLGAS